MKKIFAIITTLAIAFTAQPTFAEEAGETDDNSITNPCAGKRRMEKLRCMRSVRRGNSDGRRNDTNARTLVEKCREDRGILRTKCLREGRSVKEHKAKNRELIKERRLLRRGDRPTGPERGSESLRRLKKKELKERRRASRNEGNRRIRQKKSRMQDFRNKRKELLRERIDQVPTRKTLTKAQARNSSRRQHDRTQKKRQAVKKAHEACKEVRGRDRLTCLRENRTN